MATKILVVEDDLLSAEFMTLFLESVGHTVQTVHSFSSAVTAFDAFQPTILITDIRLDDGDGSNLAALLKRKGIHKVIGVSGLSKVQLSLSNIDISCFDTFLLKPIELDELDAAIGAELPNRQ